jgi:hypothetical protein
VVEAMEFETAEATMRGEMMVTFALTDSARRGRNRHYQSATVMCRKCIELMYKEKRRLKGDSMS